jgi:hypothetical protein
MNKTLIPLLFASTIINADIDYNKGFPVDDKTLIDNLSILEACCDMDITCCMDFSNSVSIEDFRNKVRTVDSYRDSEIRSRIRTMQIKQRLRDTERLYDVKFNNVGRYYTR